jgi:hypothetical protein
MKLHTRTDKEKEIESVKIKMLEAFGFKTDGVRCAYDYLTYKKGDDKWCSVWTGHHIESIANHIAQAFRVEGAKLERQKVGEALAKLAELEYEIPTPCDGNCENYN